MVGTTICRLLPRRFLNSPHPRDFSLPKAHRWWKRQAIFRFSGWFYGDSRDKFRPASNRVHHSMKIMSADIRNRPAMLDWFYTKRASAGCAELGMDYKDFREGLSRLDVRLSNKMLSVIAVTEPRTFAALVNLCSLQHAPNESTAS